MPSSLGSEVCPGRSPRPRGPHPPPRFLERSTEAAPDEAAPDTTLSARGPHAFTVETDTPPCTGLPWVREDRGARRGRGHGRADEP